MSGADTESRAGAAGYEQVLKKADQSVASFEEDAETPLRRLQHFLHAHPTAIPAFVLVLAIILFSFIAGSKFLHPFNFSLVLQQVTIIGIVGVAQTLIVLTAGIDLSVGAMMVLSSVVMGKFADRCRPARPSRLRQRPGRSARCAASSTASWLPSCGCRRSS